MDKIEGNYIKFPNEFDSATQRRPPELYVSFETRSQRRDEAHTSVSRSVLYLITLWEKVTYTVLAERSIIQLNMPQIQMC